ncbi:DUF6212 domain-containing protein [Aestuariivirga sp.]|uniref:DUF6212 domain-containing protein n=1 Tax=Aestuariivirga sp. TaxID=2650926 RepID=UPI00391A62C3
MTEAAKAPNATAGRNVAQPRNPLNLCLVTFALPVHGEASEASHRILSFAQQIAAQGDTVTLLWVPTFETLERIGEEGTEQLEAYYLDHFLIRLRVLKGHPDLSPLLYTPEKRSAAVYYHLRETPYDAVYFALEGGCGYYSLIASELSLFEPRPQLYVVASAPREWKAEAGRVFLKDLEEVTEAYMEKYCAAQADALICGGTHLPGWMRKQGWKLAEDITVIPPQAPAEWRPRVPPAARESAQPCREIVFLGSGAFEDGLTLLCDALDELARMTDHRPTITFLGRFGQILGEHTGGLLIRRARSWPFELKLLPGFSMQEACEYLQQRGALLVAPYLSADTPLLLAACLDGGIRFLSSAVGGIPEMLEEQSRRAVLLEPKPKAFAAGMARALKEPASCPSPRAAHARGRQILRDHLSGVAERLRTRGEPLMERSPPEQPRVSIIMVHHDRPQYLTQAIDAVKAQDYRNFELILVDDGSERTDSHALLDELAPDFAARGWQILREENRYLGAARNTGVRASRGEFILFVDDDNALFPHAVSTYVKAITASQSDICTSFQRLFYEPFIPHDARLGYVQYFPPGGSLDLGFLHDSFGDANAMIRRTVFDRIGYQLEDYGYTAQDWEFFTRAVLAGLKLRVIPEPLYWYRSSTSGMYRNSHWYDNRLPILAAFRRHGFAGLEHVYHLALSTFVGKTETQMLRENLRYSPSDELHLQLATLDPNAQEALELLAEIAAREGRGSTAITLLGRARAGNLQRKLESAFLPPSPAERALAELGAEFTADAPLALDQLKRFSVSAGPGRAAPEAYIEKPDRLYVPASHGTATVAVLAAGCPAGTSLVSAKVALDQAMAVPTEFMILLAPPHLDPVMAVRQAPESAGEGCSGWCRVSYSYEERTIEAFLSLPAAAPMNLVLAVRNAGGGEAISTLGRFGSITLRRSLGDPHASRPRVGAPPLRQRARLWTDEERKSAVLTTPYESELPLLMFPSYADGLFLRPSREGVVAVQLPWAFPAFARKALASVEITHADASPFAFAIGLSRPMDKVTWKGDVPHGLVAFSGWHVVKDKFKLHEIPVEMREVVKSALHVSLAIRLPKGSSPTPAHSFFRKLVLVWET